MTLLVRQSKAATQKKTLESVERRSPTSREPVEVSHDVINDALKYPDDCKAEKGM